MKPFNLEQALAGAKLVTRDGREVTEFRVSGFRDGCNYVATVGDNRIGYTDNGFVYEGIGTSGYDLFMAEDVAPEKPKLEAGMWVKCVKPVSDKTAGVWYQAFYETFTTALGTVTDLVIKGWKNWNTPVTSVNGRECFDLDNPLPYNPDATTENPVSALIDTASGIHTIRALCKSDLICHKSDESMVVGINYTFEVGTWYRLGQDTDGNAFLWRNGCLVAYVPEAIVLNHFDLSTAHEYDPSCAAPATPAPPQSVLLEAHNLIYGEREADYGSVTDNFARIAAGWQVILGTTVTPEQVGPAMAWLKIARQVGKPKRDNLVDAAGYIGCVDKIGKGL